MSSKHALEIMSNIEQLYHITQQYHLILNKQKQILGGSLINKKQRSTEQELNVIHGSTNIPVSDSIFIK